MPKTNLGQSRPGDSLIGQSPGETVVDYPAVYLNHAQVKAVPPKMKMGEERTATIKVRLASLSNRADGYDAASLEIVEIEIEGDKESPAAAFYPTMRVDGGR